MANLIERFNSAWNVFRGNEKPLPEKDYGEPIFMSQRRTNMTSFTSEGSIVTKIYNQISIDVASASLRHVRIGPDRRYEEDMRTGLADCLSLRPNIDQTPARFIQDLVWVMFDEGTAAVVPVDTDLDVRSASGYEIKSLRVGKVSRYFPRHVEIELYNDRTGRSEKVTLPKENVAIVTNPLYEAMNKPNSDLRRLVEKLRILDAIDKQSSSGKLDLIIQLPYEVRSELKEKQAQQRRKSIEDQLENSQHGIAYVGATEKITQLNRSIENNLMEQITFLTTEVYNALGLTKEVFNGTANEAAMLTYYKRTVDPILDEIASALTWGLLSQTARTQGQAVRWFRSPFALVPLSQFAEIATQLTSAEIVSSNEIRAQLGWKPAGDENADQLRNANINPVDKQPTAPQDPTPTELGGTEAPPAPMMHSDLSADEGTFGAIPIDLL